MPFRPYDQGLIGDANLFSNSVKTGETGQRLFSGSGEAVT